MEMYFLIGMACLGVCMIVGKLIATRMEQKMTIKLEATRMRFIRTELIPEIRDAVLEVIVEANEESMEMIPEKLKDIRREIERE